MSSEAIPKEKVDDGDSVVVLDTDQEDDGGLLVDGDKLNMIRLIKDEFPAIYDWRKREATGGRPGRPPIPSKVWEDLAARMGNGITAETARSWWKVMRDKFGAEKRSVEQNANYKTTWPYYSELAWYAPYRWQRRNPDDYRTAEARRLRKRAAEDTNGALLRTVDAESGHQLTISSENAHLEASSLSGVDLTLANEWKLSKDLLSLLYLLQQILSFASDSSGPSSSTIPVAPEEYLFSIGDEDNLFGRLIALRLKGMSAEQKNMMKDSLVAFFEAQL